MNAPESHLQVYDLPYIQKTVAIERPDGLQETALTLEGIHCGGCVRRCEQGLTDVPGVQDFQVNLSTRRAQLVWNPTQIKLSAVLQKLAQIGYPAYPYDARQQEDRYRRERNRALRRLAVAGFGMMQIMMLAIALYAGDFYDMDEAMRGFLRWVSLFVALPVVFYAAQPFFLNAWNGLKNGQLGMDVPVSLAIGGAFLASCWATIQGGGEVYFDSVSMFTFFLLLGRFLEMGARHKASRSSEDLIHLLPAIATRLDNDQETLVPVAQLKRGDTVLVKPGETIPADAKIISGASSVDESLLTGESLPLSKHSDERVIGGSVNIESPLTLRIEKVGPDTVLSAMNRVLQRAQLEKPQLARLADRVASYFVGALLLVASVVAYWWSQHQPADAFWITLSVLVVTCPCALSLATPAALTAATGAMTRLGLLITRGHALETLARVDHIIFDKTGTLTLGQLQVDEVIPQRGLAADQCLSIAAALERQSEHPIGKALVKKAIKEAALPEISAERSQATKVTASPGLGMEGLVAGRHYRIGNPAYALGLSGKPLAFDTDHSGSLVVLADEQGPLAVFRLDDELRPQALETVAALKRLGLGVEIGSGDHAPAVRRIAEQLGIEYFNGGMRPEQKLQRVRALQAQGKIVAMVGDGVNDSPVLACAQVSIAMGSGTEIARSSADMVLLSERLDRIVDGVQLARRSLRIIRQNLAWALGYNAVALPLAAGGFIAPWMAAIGMSLSSLIVVLNALRLSRMITEAKTDTASTPLPISGTMQQHGA